ncbi:hypothetical protein [Actinomadura flavalba]|uniref:hypothetical protein n=1 Tax=Actinomadura flavalba TaxID=1120938 RepID=UPI00039DF16F|nr:hypothetical protein [Actinomadura flavalba]
MSNGARHGIGALAGLIASPVLFALLLFAGNRAERVYRQVAIRYADSDPATTALALGAFAALGIIVALLAGSRVSPLAALLPGLAFTLFGGLFLLWPVRFGHELMDVLGHRLTSLLTMGSLGVPFLLGVILVVSALPPSRWRSRRPAAVPPAPMPGAPPGPVGPQARFGAPQFGAPQFGEQRPPARQEPPPYAPPPAPPREPERSPDAWRRDDDEPGEWTRKFGGEGR